MPYTIQFEPSSVASFPSHINRTFLIIRKRKRVQVYDSYQEATNYKEGKGEGQDDV